MATYNRSDLDSTIINGRLTGLYYYYVNSNEVYKATYLGFCPNIINVAYNPFLAETDLDLYVSPFDSDKFGKIDGQIPNVNRITNFDTVDKQLFTLRLGDSYSNSVDAKLNCYPYRYFLLTDYINPPILIQPQLIRKYENGELKLNVKVKYSLSTNGGYKLYIEGYKGDSTGDVEGVHSTNHFLIANSSSAYSQFLSTNSNTFANSNNLALLENDLSLKQTDNSYFNNERNNIMQSYANIINSAMGAINNPLGSIGNIANIGFNAYMNDMNNKFNLQQATDRLMFNEMAINKNAQAKVNDLLQTPKSLITSGNDSMYNMALCNYKIDLIEFRISDDMQFKISDFFERYGYSANFYGYIDEVLNQRKNYNYIKTSIANIEGSKVPVEDLEEIKEIFNKGFTAWKVENNISVNDYTVNNDFQ